MASVADDGANEGTSEQMHCDEAEEEMHHLECNVAMLQYSAYLSKEINRRERHLMKVPLSHRNILPFNNMVSDISALRKAAMENQKLLYQIVDGSIYEKHRPYLNAKYATCTARPHHMSKVKTTIEQIVRDWSKEGAAERKECYEPLIQELKKRLPITSKDNQHSVLVPGFGLARILLEIAALGYFVEGNEFDYFMIFASTFFLNSGVEAFSLNLYPYIHNPCNVLSRRADSLKCVKVPDISTIDILKQNPNINMRMCSGEFLRVYNGEEYKESFDCVLTCFFIDTAPNVIEYLHVIKKILKPSGYWINLGPLQYHWYEFGLDATDTGLDSRYQESIELSYDELKQAILKLDFTFLHEEVGRSCHYNALNKIKRQVYDCTFFTVQK